MRCEGKVVLLQARDEEVDDDEFTLPADIGDLDPNIISIFDLAHCKLTGVYAMDDHLHLVNYHLLPRAQGRSPKVCGNSRTWLGWISMVIHWLVSLNNCPFKHFTHRLWFAQVIDVTARVSFDSLLMSLHKPLCYVCADDYRDISHKSRAIHKPHCSRPGNEWPDRSEHTPFTLYFVTRL